MPRNRWDDRSSGRRRAIRVLSAVQFALAAAAWIDLSRRPVDQVTGRKWWWAFAIAVNFVGPIAYFRWGRRKAIDPVIPSGGAA